MQYHAKSHGHEMRQNKTEKHSVQDREFYIFLAIYWQVIGNLMQFIGNLLTIYRQFIGNLLAIYWQFIGNLSAIYRQFIGNLLAIYVPC